MGASTATPRYTFTFDGRELTGHAGDTLGSALLANGMHQVTTSIKLGRPRGITAAWAEDTGGLVQIEEPFPEPMLLATTVELFDGLVARGIPGQGRLAEIPDTAKYDATHVHTDVLVAGAGPAGLAAALTAARAGARVVLLDEHNEAGGALLGTTDTIDGRPAQDWVADAVAELATYPDVLHLQRTTAFGHYDDGFILALQRRTDHLGGEAPAAVSRQRVWRIRARHIVVAAGAHERPVVFADNDRPGIMLAHGARTFLHRYGVKVGTQAVVFTTNDSAYLAAFDLHDAGVRINAIVDSRDEVAAHLRDGLHRPQHLAAHRIGGQRHPWQRARHPRDRVAARRHPGPVGLRRAAGQRWLEPGRAPVQPGPRPAALRRRVGRVRARRASRRRQRRRIRGAACSTCPDACVSGREAASGALRELGFTPAADAFRR